jgi:hypothetical protein
MHCILGVLWPKGCGAEIKNQKSIKSSISPIKQIAKGLFISYNYF